MVVSLGEEFYGNIISEGVWFRVCYIADSLVIFIENEGTMEVLQTACIEDTRMGDQLNSLTSLSLQEMLMMELLVVRWLHHISEVQWLGYARLQLKDKYNIIQVLSAHYGKYLYLQV